MELADRTSSQRNNVSDAPSEKGFPLHLRWDNVCFDVEDTINKDEDGSVPIKRILHNVSGQVAPGQLLAVMGPSGSGKTTLLRILAQRVKEGVTGDVLVNDHEVPSNIRKISGFVTQDEEWFNSLTVQETLGYSAELKMPVDLPYAEKMERVAEVVDELDLTKCVDTPVGETSGGERRRLAIGVQIVEEPSLLFLDEPTSGLDAASALMVIQKLKQMARRGKTIICTIHQPRMSVLKLFDNLMLLADGKTTYFGPSAPKCLDFFSSVGYECPKFENPADFMLDLVNTRLTPEEAAALLSSNSESDLDPPQLDDEEKEKTVADSPSKESLAGAAGRAAVVQKLHDEYLASDLHATMMKKYEPMPAQIIPEPASSLYATPFTNQVSVVLRRSFLHKYREPIATATQAFNSTLLPLIVGAIYWQLNLGQSGATDRLSAISFFVLLQSFLAFDILLLFPIERSIYLREQESGAYRTSAFYIGRTLSETPNHVVFAFIAACITYWMMGFQNDAEKFFVWCLIIINTTLTGASLLLFCGAISKALEQSNMIATLMLILFMLFDGNWVSVDSIPAVFRWINGISFMAYGVESAVKNEYDGLVFSCQPDELVGTPGVCPIPDGETFLQTHGFGSVDIAFNMGIMLVLQFFFRLGAYFGLRFLFTGKSFKERLYN